MIVQPFKPVEHCAIATEHRPAYVEHCAIATEHRSAYVEQNQIRKAV